MRRYGDKLDKFEPNDLNGTYVPCPEYFDLLDPNLLSNAKGKISEADWIEELNEFFEKLIVASERTLIAG
jgi:hypothetical protein